MVGIVIVSHSAKLAEGAAELARQMAAPDAKIIAAGGFIPPDASEPAIGTDPMRVMEAIQEADTGDGVLVLMDLGSALMSAEMALSFLDDDQRARVKLCDAPLIEGVVAAATCASAGGSAEQCAKEARGALAAKIAHLGGDQTDLPAQPDEIYASQAGRPAEELRITMPNKLGFHARPAARLAQALAPFKADVSLQNSTRAKPAGDARSVNAILLQSARNGDEIIFSASGPDAAPALAAIRQLAEANFGDDDSKPTEKPSAKTEAPPAKPAKENELRGISASPGIGIGQARFVRARARVSDARVSDPAQAWQELQTALGVVGRKLASLGEAARKKSGAAAGDIFAATLVMLNDADLRETARKDIYENKLNPAAAWMGATERMAAQLDAADDEYLRARSTDVRDLGHQVAAQLAGEGQDGSRLAGGGHLAILIADDFAPADVAGLADGAAAGLCAARGSHTSHAAILARGFGIPCVFGLGDGVLALAEDTPLIVDGTAGAVFIRPDEATKAEYEHQLAVRREAEAKAREQRHALAQTKDGVRVEIAANIGSVEQARAAVEQGAEGVGLFRTEFLFLDRATAPSEDEQAEAYAAAACAMQGRPLVIRTLDAGGDKPIPYLNLPPEANPFLGFRAVRIGLAMPELFMTQLRAIARAVRACSGDGSPGGIKVMFPMIATLAEFRAAKELLARALDEVGCAARPEIGMMVEIPSAVFDAEKFAPETDFFSIGTNDLTQYLFAAERGNNRVAHLADSAHPVVLRAIAQVAQAAQAAGKWVGICGELAGDPAILPVLVGLGVNELSMSARLVPRAKQIVRELTLPAAQAIAQRALACETAEDVRAITN
ncbi:MAG TPA: phosphoenolpyruvate--protein phosphotransferase [Thermoflexales bacterium]|nr:phosphoenolpyruvate--protein phosphotransferase [Thermoflexales bacterium]